MDILNDHYPLYPQNPNVLSESEESDNNEYINRLDSINNRKKRRKTINIDDYFLKYNDDIWYIWCIINDYSVGSGILDQLSYASFCDICYQNSSK